MKLGELAAAIPGALLSGDPGTIVLGIGHDSRTLKPGELFVAIRGLVADGNQFVESARKKGAAAVVSEAAAPDAAPWIQVQDAREALATLAAALLGEPARSLELVGVTGTNGKTTTTYLIDAALRAGDKRVGLIGTIHYRVADRLTESARTTPESSDLQELFREMVDARCSHAVLEVSSHSLALKRVHGCAFKVAVFTNLTRDHLDFHGDMDGYFAAKRLLFASLLREDGVAVINADDARASELAAASRGQVMSYGIDNPADVSARDVQLTIQGSRFVARTKVAELPIESALLGRFNVSNLLAALAAALALGIDPETAVRGLQSMRGVPGRMERVEAGQEFAIIVDYAHTDDALRNLLETVRDLKPNRIITVFGCGGDRDRTKRPLMGAVAARLSDVIVITSDNPRSEPPEAIVEEILRGVNGGRRAERHVIVDRREAIARAIELARPGDAVVLAGKGHETYQVLRDRTVPFDDRQVARETLQKLLRGLEDVIAVALPTTFALEELVAAANGTLVTGRADREISGISIDTRTLSPGDLFVAVAGPRFNGHDFLANASAKGAVAAFVSQDVVGPPGLDLVRVRDTTQTLGDLARHMRLASGLPLVAITGSVGKTTTKDMTAALLETRGPVLKTEGNLNNRFGVPLTLFRLKPEHTAAVLELGMSAAGELSSLTQIARPDVAVITNVAPVHLEFFPSIDAIARAKAEILEGLRPFGAAVLNFDDPRVRAIGEGHRGDALWFGRDRRCDVSAESLRGTPHGVRFDLWLDGKGFDVALPLAGFHFVSNFLAAAAAALRLGVAAEAIAEAASHMTPAPHRGQALRLRQGVTLIDDSYNSNPVAVDAAITSLELAALGRRVAFLGDMLELGKDSVRLHEETGARIAPQLQALVGVGPLSAALVKGAGKAGMQTSGLHWFPDAAQAAEAVNLVEPGDAVLVKGSRGMRMEQVVDALVARFGILEA